jgi:hypothetical protein
MPLITVSTTVTVRFPSERADYQVTVTRVGDSGNPQFIGQVTAELLDTASREAHAHIRGAQPADTGSAP